MKLLRDSAWSLSSSVLPTLVSIATVPFFVSAIGAGRYGVLAIAWLVLGYFGAADFGIGRAITQRISAMRGESRAAMASAVWSALVSMAVFGLAGAVLVFIASRWYFGGPFQAERGLRGEILAAVWILALCNPVVTVNGVLSGALIGLERFRFVSVCTTLSNTALLLFPLFTAWWISTDLSALILASLAARILGMIPLAVGAWAAFLRGEMALFSKAEFGRLANFGAWIMVTALVGPIMVSADRFLIGAFQNAAAVAAYAIPFQIASRTLMFPVAVTQALFPRFASDDIAASAARCRDFTVLVAQSFAPLIVALICLAAPLLELWLGDALDPRSVIVAQFVLAGFWSNAVAQVPYGFIQARGNPRFTALLHLAELPFYLALLFALGGRFGLTGYAAAFGLRCLADCLLLCRKAGAADGYVMVRMAISGVLVIGAVLAGTLIGNWWVLLSSACGFALLAFLALAAGLPPAIRNRLAELPLLRSRIGMWALTGRPPSG